MMNNQKQDTLLATINSPADLKKLSLEELEQLGSEIRQKIIETVSKPEDIWPLVWGSWN